MIRNIDLNEISDGKKYRSNDMAKISCNDCQGCSECCHVVGETIVLDPYDICQITSHLNLSFEEMLNGVNGQEPYISIHVEQGLVLPHIRINSEKQGCGFLNIEGRCSIHAFRPGFCRLYPLGRVYDEDEFYYILQVNECMKGNRTKVKIEKWIDIPEIKKYEKYIQQYHGLCREIQKQLSDLADEKSEKEWNMLFLTLFFQKKYSGTMEFYQEFQERFQQFTEIIKK